MQYLGIDNGREATLLSVPFPPMGMSTRFHSFRCFLLGIKLCVVVAERVVLRPMTRDFHRDLDKHSLKALDVYIALISNFKLAGSLILVVVSISAALNKLFCLTKGDCVPLYFNQKRYWLEVRSSSVFLRHICLRVLLFRLHADFGLQACSHGVHPPAE